MHVNSFLILIFCGEVAYVMSTVHFKSPLIAQSHPILLKMYLKKLKRGWGFDCTGQMIMQVI
jgi:hypothetical protein